MSDDKEGYYREILPTYDDAIREVLALESSYGIACRRMWQLYLAGTEQTEDSYRGAGVDIITDVVNHIQGLRKLALDLYMAATDLEEVDRPDTLPEGAVERVSEYLWDVQHR